MVARQTNPITELDAAKHQADAQYQIAEQLEMANFHLQGISNSLQRLSNGIDKGLTNVSEIVHIVKMLSMTMNLNALTSGLDVFPHNGASSHTDENDRERDL